MGGNKVIKRILVNAASGGTPIATTYTQIDANGVGGYTASKLQYYNGTGQFLTLAVGKSTLEQDVIQLPPTTSPVVVEVMIPESLRLSLKSDVLTTTGKVALDFFVK